MRTLNSHSTIQHTKFSASTWFDVNMYALLLLYHIAWCDSIPWQLAQNQIHKKTTRNSAYPYIMLVGSAGFTIYICARVVQWNSAELELSDHCIIKLLMTLPFRCLCWQLAKLVGESSEHFWQHLCCQKKAGSCSEW